MIRHPDNAMGATQADSKAIILSLDSKPLPRSIYAARLSEFPEFTFADRAAFQFRGIWRDYFGRRMGSAFGGRIILDIGCFDAAFLSRIAAKHPTTAFIGLDWKCKAIYDGAKLVDSLGLNNIALLRGRGQDVSRMFAEGEVDEIWLFQPEPCDRDCDLKTRLITEPFLCTVHRVLRDSSSVLAFKTDDSGSYHWVNRVLVAAQQNGNHFDVACASMDYWNDPLALAHTACRFFTGEATAYENRFLKKRLPIHYLEMRKICSNANARFPGESAPCNP